MGNILLILIFCILIFYAGNAFLYIFNVTNFLFGSEFRITDDLFINYIYLLLISLFILGILLLINNRLFKYFRNPYHYFVLSLIYCIVFFFIENVILNNDKLLEINNILSIVLIIILTTYTFYYSMYFITKKKK